MTVNAIGAGGAALTLALSQRERVIFAAVGGGLIAIAAALTLALSRWRPLHNSSTSRTIGRNMPQREEIAMHRKTSEPSFIDVLVPDHIGRNDQLDRIDQMIDWPKVAKQVNGLYASPEGRPAYPPITMVKIIILQQWYDASDTAIEEAVSDRLSFRRFAGLSLQDAVPDHSTISRFRKAVAERGLAQRLFEEVGRQLEKKGLLVKKGTLIDAS